MSEAHGVPPRGAPPGASDQLRLVVGGQEWIGWQRVAVTRALDTVPAIFDIQVTERYPLARDVAFRPGDPCQVKIGGDLVITGYLDRYAASLGPTDHTVRISGRSKSADLVDCSAFVGDRENPQFQIMGGTALSIAQQLAQPYGVEISSIAGPGADIPRFNINLGETPWEIIDRLTRISQLIAYDLPDGTIQLAQAGSEQMASGFSQGENIETASVTFSMDERFSDYECFPISTLTYFVDEGLNRPIHGAIAKDAGVPRFRKRIIISEQTQMGQSIADKRAQWECNRRLGRSQAVNIICDSWRDAGGKLWAPNHLAPIRLPELKLADATWVIGAVTYVRDETGQHSQIALMPKEAFEPEPQGDIGRLPPLVQDVEAWNAAHLPDKSGAQ